MYSQTMNARRISNHRRAPRPSTGRLSAAAVLAVSIGASSGLLSDGQARLHAETIADSFIDYSHSGEQGQFSFGAETGEEMGNWYYGYYDLSADRNESHDPLLYSRDDFTQFTNSAGPGGGNCTPGGNHWDGEAWLLEDLEDMFDSDSGQVLMDGPWTAVHWQVSHPNGSDAANGGLHWAVRRWQAAGSSGACESADLDPGMGFPPEGEDVWVTWHVKRSDQGNANARGSSAFLILHRCEGDETVLLDSVTMPRSARRGITRIVPVPAMKPGDAIDLCVSPLGSDGLLIDGGDITCNMMKVTRGAPDYTIGPAPPFIVDPTAVITHAELDYSDSVQGGEGAWQYGYYDRSQDDPGVDGFGVYDPESDFIAFAGDQVIGGSWGIDFDEPEDFPPLLVTSDGGSPLGGPNGGQWSIRRWRSDLPEETEVQIDGMLQNLRSGERFVCGPTIVIPCLESMGACTRADQVFVPQPDEYYPNQELERGDGITGRVYVDGEMVWSGDSNGALRRFTLDLVLGPDSVVDLCLDAAGPDGPNSANHVGDESHFSVIIAHRYDENRGGAPSDSGLRPFVRGDVNSDDVINLSDGVAILRQLFSGRAGGGINCLDAADVDADRSIGITDAIRVLSWLFIDANSITFPFPGPPSDVVNPGLYTFEECAVDPQSTFGCRFPSPCRGIPERIRSRN